MVDVHLHGTSLDLYVRGERLDSVSAFSLDHEMAFQGLLAERGIRVPRVHGRIDDPVAYVTDRAAGSDDFDGTDDDARRAAMEDYVDILVNMHALDPAPFADAGIVRADRPERSHLVGLEHFERQAYRAEKKRPDPFLEFALGWLRRNEPENPGREGPIVWDAGQFHHQDGRITALLDLEFGHIGDPLSDLAALWVRNPFIAFGDVAHLMRRYRDRSGTDLDLDAIRWHYILWCLSNQLEFHAVLAEPVPGTDYMLNLHWCIETNLMALEAIASALEVPLDVVEPVTATRSAYAPASTHLTRSLEELTADGEGYARYRTRMAVRLASHLERVGELGAAVVAADLAEAGALTGVPSSTWEAGEAELEGFVLDDGGEHDAALVTLFNRRLHRARMLTGPEGSWITQHRDVAQPAM